MSYITIYWKISGSENKEKRVQFYESTYWKAHCLFLALSHVNSSDNVIGEKKLDQLQAVEPVPVSR